MNASNAKDYLPLVQALAEGKEIQHRGAGGWCTVANPSFSDPASDYRIKPEPREIFVVNGNEDLAFFDKSDAIAYGGNVVRYREVIE